MMIEVSTQEIQTILESLKYSKQRVADAEGTPETVRRENLLRIDAVAKKIREACQASS